MCFGVCVWKCREKKEDKITRKSGVHGEIVIVIAPAIIILINKLLCVMCVVCERECREREREKKGYE